MNQLFQFAEIKRYYKWSLWTRPILIYSLTVCFLAVTLTTCILLVLGQTTMNDTSAIFITIIGAVAPVLAIIFGGKSYERSRGVKDSDEVVAAEASVSEKPDFDPFSSSMEADPMALLRSMDLSEYEPRVADDHPVIR